MLTTFLKPSEIKQPDVRPFFDMSNETTLEVVGSRVELFSNEIMRSKVDDLSETLAAGIDAGEDFRKLATRVMGVYEGILDKGWQARRIARTETMYALNAGTFEGYKQSQAVEDKIWVATRDQRVRGADPGDEFNHLAADGQRKKLDEPFEVSGERLMFPGDQSLGATAGNVINERCTFRHKVKRRSKS